MTHRRTSRRSWIALAALAALAVGAAASIDRAEALIFCPVLGAGGCTYYSDASLTTVVGTCSKPCCGEVTSTGQTSPYRHCVRGECPAQLCPGGNES